MKRVILLHVGIVKVQKNTKMRNICGDGYLWNCKAICLTFWLTSGHYLSLSASFWSDDTLSWPPSSTLFMFRISNIYVVLIVNTPGLFESWLNELRNELAIVGIMHHKVSMWQSVSWPWKNTLIDCKHQVEVLSCGILVSPVTYYMNILAQNSIWAAFLKSQST